MLSVSITPLSLGVTISGTEDDLMELYEAISDILPEDDAGIDVEFTLGLNYDLRKAWSGKRTVETKICLLLKIVLYICLKQFIQLKFYYQF